MEKFQENFQKARQYLQVGEHILQVTYPVVQEPKVLASVLENIFLSITNSMGAVLHFERMHRRVPPFHNNFDSKYTIFAMKVVGSHDFTEADAHAIEEVKNMVCSHKEAPMAFSRSDTFVICDDSYVVKKLSVDLMKSYITLAKQLLQKTEAVIKQ